MGPNRPVAASPLTNGDAYRLSFGSPAADAPPPTGNRVRIDDLSSYPVVPTEPPPGAALPPGLPQPALPSPLGGHVPVGVAGTRRIPPNVSSAPLREFWGRAGAAPPGGELSGHGVCWVAAHGGAGATTMAAAIGGVDLGSRWPSAARGEPAQVMLVARTHAGGMRAASRALGAIREGRHPAGMTLIGLVLLADAPGRLPRVLVRHIKVLRAVVPVWRVPWIPEWRLGKPTERFPAQLIRLRASIEERVVVAANGGPRA